MSVPAVLIHISTGEIIKHAPLPTNDPNQPIPGLDPAYKWLIKYTPFAAPDYDERLFLLNQIEEVTTTPHPTYSNYDQYKITFTTIKRPAPEIVDQVVNAEQNANQQLVPPIDQLKILTLGLAVLFREVEGLTLNAKETALKNRIMGLAAKVWQNDAARKAKEAEVAANQEPNLDQGFVTS